MIQVILLQPVSEGGNTFQLNLDNWICMELFTSYPISSPEDKTMEFLRNGGASNSSKIEATSAR